MLFIIQIVLSRLLGVPTFKNQRFIRFGWVINITNDFSWWFLKCKFYQCRTHPVDAKLLPTQPTYQLGYRLRGQKFNIDKVCLKSRSFWESPVKIHDVVGTPRKICIFFVLNFFTKEIQKSWNTLTFWIIYYSTFWKVEACDNKTHISRTKNSFIIPHYLQKYYP